MRFRGLIVSLMCALTLAGLMACGDDEDLVILTEQLPNGRVGVAYSFVLEVEGDADEFVLVAGTLPPGIDFSIDGEFGGIPTEAGSFTFTVEAIDLSRGLINDRISKGFSLVIEA
ncbi:putative Ig domain-containing protein [Candidatus Entotheonella palauensis]|uniref:putative Ig domain-containing protein n=1 Tax=Candidatus Entotheonella palauensis TaxID=93172 RepID=UPI000B7DFD06|nr:putative Ig domain-containing protein [Candidatus Entotheonella palauensis]